MLFHITDCINTTQHQWGLLLNVYSVYKSCISFQWIEQGGPDSFCHHCIAMIEHLYMFSSFYLNFPTVNVLFGQ